MVWRTAQTLRRYSEATSLKARPSTLHSMKSIDAAQLNLTQVLQITSMVLLTKIPVQLRNCAYLDILEQLDKLGLHLTHVDAGILLSKQEKPSVRTHSITLDEHCASEVLGGLLTFFLFSNISLTLTVHAKTYDSDQRTISWYHELVYRYTRKYLQTYSLGVLKATQASDGILEIRVQSKAALSRVSQPLRIKPRPMPSHVFIELIDMDERLIEQQEKLLRLAYKPKGLPLRVATRVAPFRAFTQVYFFGNELGYDNDMPFLQGMSKIGLGKDEELELIRQFTGAAQVLGPEETLLLLPVIALVGGRLPVDLSQEALAEELQRYSQLLAIDFSLESASIETEGYAVLHTPEIVDLEDI